MMKKTAIAVLLFALALPTIALAGFFASGVKTATPVSVVIQPGTANILATSQIVGNWAPTAAPNSGNPYGPAPASATIATGAQTVVTQTAHGFGPGQMIQFAGTLPANTAATISASGTWTTGTATITMGSSNPGTVVAGMPVYDASNNNQFVGIVQTYTGSTLTLTANATTASLGSTDSLNFYGGIVAGQLYWVESAGLTANTYRISADAPVATINNGGSGYSASATAGALTLTLTYNGAGCTINPVVAVTLSGTSISSGYVTQSGVCPSGYPTNSTAWTLGGGLLGGSGVAVTLSDGGDLATSGTASGVTVNVAGYNDYPVAVWDEAPFQLVAGTQTVCLPARHKSGIASVQFLADNGAALTVTKATTGHAGDGVPEYCATLDDSLFSDRLHELRAIVTPNYGYARVLQSAHTVTLANSSTLISDPGQDFLATTAVQFTSLPPSGNFTCLYGSTTFCYVCYTSNLNNSTPNTPGINNATGYTVSTSQANCATTGLQISSGAADAGTYTIVPAGYAENEFYWTAGSSLWFATNKNGGYLAKQYYADQATGVDTNNCTAAATPCLTIAGALTKADITGAFGTVTTGAAVGGTGNCAIFNTQFNHGLSVSDGVVLWLSSQKLLGQISTSDVWSYRHYVVDPTNNFAAKTFSLDLYPGGPCIGAGAGNVNLNLSGMAAMRDVSFATVNLMCDAPPCNNVANKGFVDGNASTNAPISLLGYLNIKPNVGLTHSDVAIVDATASGMSISKTHLTADVKVQAGSVLLQNGVSNNNLFWFDGITYDGYTPYSIWTGAAQSSSKMGASSSIKGSRPICTSVVVTHIADGCTTATLNRNVTATWIGETAWGAGGSQVILNSTADHLGLYFWPATIVVNPTTGAAPAAGDTVVYVSGASGAPITVGNPNATPSQPSATGATNSSMDAMGFVPVNTANNCIGSIFPQSANAGQRVSNWNATPITGGFGTAYAVTLAPTATTNANSTWTTASTTITMASSNNGAVIAGQKVYDNTNSGTLIGSVQSYSATTLTLTAPALAASIGSTDNLTFSGIAGTSNCTGNYANVQFYTGEHSAVVGYPTTTATMSNVLVENVSAPASSQVAGTLFLSGSDIDTVWFANSSVGVFSGAGDNGSTIPTGGGISFPVFGGTAGHISNYNANNVAISSYGPNYSSYNSSLALNYSMTNLRCASTLYAYSGPLGTRTGLTFTPTPRRGGTC